MIVLYAGLWIRHELSIIPGLEGAVICLGDFLGVTGEAANEAAGVRPPTGVFATCEMNVGVLATRDMVALPGVLVLDGAVGGLVVVVAEVTGVPGREDVEEEIDFVSGSIGVYPKNI